MAEASAAAAAAVSQHRFFCHSCKGEVSPKLPVSPGRSEGPGRAGAGPGEGRGPQRPAERGRGTVWRGRPGAGGQRCPRIAALRLW